MTRSLPALCALALASLLPGAAGAAVADQAADTVPAVTFRPPAGSPAAPDSLTAFLRDRGREPVEYVVEKTGKHRVVILGEHHWLLPDVELVRRLIPRLPEAGVATLAVEMFPGAMQEEIDALVGAPAYDEDRAMAILRLAEWPYAEYGALMRETWAVNRRLAAEGRPPLRLLGIGPVDEGDWRAALRERGLNGDTYMAGRILDAAREGRVLVYIGLHHAFTRYHQVETMLDGSVRATIERTGNVLRREMGDRVFMISLHKPWSCGEEDARIPCLPLDGAIDCAAAPVGRPVAFDVASSPFASIRMQDDAYYALAGPMMRLVDFADGYVWSGPLGEYRSVEVLPLSTYAPDDTALAWVMAHNPFGDPVASPAELESVWRTEREAATRLVETRGWGPLVERAAACAP
jgi:hypothetical protein